MGSRWEDHDKGWAPADNVPAGTYQAKIADLDLDDHPRFRDEQLRWDLEVIGPTCQGSKLVKWASVDAGRMDFVRKDLSTLGIQLEKFSELEYRRQDLIGAVVEIAVQYQDKESAKGTKYTVQNVWINKLVTQAAAMPAVQQQQPPKGQPNAAATVNDDDVPF
jgi:hypothetical protein